MDGEVPRERWLCHFLLLAGRIWGRGWQGSQAITQSQFIFLPPAEPEVVPRPAIGSFLTHQGGSLPSLYTCPVAKAPGSHRGLPPASLYSYLWLPVPSTRPRTWTLPLTAAV